MKQSTRLSSAVFQLTPTRTRCDLIIIANEKKEKIASGLLNPFLAHLKTAQDQIAKGGYSILLEPETGSDAAWFTKATLERFVRFVSTPEILERVYTIETEILQIEEAMAMQRRNDIGQSIVENHQTGPRGGSEGDKSVPNANEEKAIVLYTPGAPAPEANGSCSQEGNSKAQLLKVLDTRKAVLQKEQGMAFARAVAAGFDIDHMAALVSFAECFGAMRLMGACSRFMDLWKSKHEMGQWLDVEASGAFSTQLDFTAMNASCIVLSDTLNKRDISNPDLASDNNATSCSTNNADNPVPNGEQVHFQGQFPHLAFPPWSMHPPPGAQPVFQPYPVQGMPYPHPGQKRQSLDVRDSNTGSEMWEIDRTRSLDDMASDEEISQSRKSRKKAGGSNKKQSGMVVIRNINYITSKEKKSGSETNSHSHSDIDTENEYSEADGNNANHENNKRSSGRRGVDKLNRNKDEVSTLGKDTDDRHWKAFQDCLLRGTNEDACADNDRIFAMEKDVKIKRQANRASDDPLGLGAQDRSENQYNRMTDFRRISGSTSYRHRGSGDEVLLSSADNDFKGGHDHADIQFAETNGRKILFSTAHEDFIIGSQRNRTNIRNSSDPLTMSGFQGASNKLDRDSSLGMADESLVVPFRSMSLQAEGTDRTTLDIDSEIPSKYQKLESEGNKKIVNYEPNDLSMMPERGIDKRSFGYDLALDYEMQVCAEGSEDKGKIDTDVKGGARKSDKDRRSKVMSDSLQKQRTGGPMRKGKSTKMSPLEDARARAERLRSYKADLQKMKKEQEEAELKRLESLKRERQKRIAARGGSTAAKPSTLSPQTKQLPSNLSVTPNRGSKFSDSEPGSSSPLQRSKVRTPLGSSDSHKASKASKLSEGSHTAGTRLIRSMPSLSETKKENNGLTPDPKATMYRIRRLSEPKKIITPPVTTMKARSAEAITKRKLSEGPERNKVSAIINLDKSKAATLPELKIKTPVSRANKGENRSAVKDKQEVNGTRSFMFPENAEQNVDNCNTAHQIDADDNPIVEKTVLVLEHEKPSHPILYSSKGNPEVQNQQHNNHDKGEKSNVISESAPIRAPPSRMDRVDREPITCQRQKHSDYNEVKTAYSEKDPPNVANISTTEKPYQAPYARVSSLEDPCTHQSEYGKAPVASSEVLSRAEETVKTRVPDVKALKVETKKVTPGKTLVKEPSKGLRRLLKFGKKNHTTSSVDQSVDSECSGGTGIKHHENARKTASTSEVYTLKNLISQEEPSTAGKAPQKTSRHFSLFSPFRSKTSEKKQAS
ncbi:COP1-interacting protein 7 [Sesamum alatum]|uniref:COP1-interacting protein 7 n=1 Tax=Sesamum alatum TaxID=300844 RepID=A0AAE1Y0Z4_9LAMI|nr:COP1-interacting protein 7 [Sesamum alatum]